MERRLHRSRDERILAGVCGGMGEYFDVDPVFIRLGFVVAAIFGGTGIIAYIVLAIVMPSAEQVHDESRPAEARSYDEEGEETSPTMMEVYSGSANERSPEVEEEQKARRRRAAGAILVLLGLLFLAAELNWFFWLRADLIWPLVLIGLGVLLVLSQRGR